MRELTIELEDAAKATALRAELSRRGLSCDCPDGGPVVQIDLIERNRERRVEEVLSAVDRWLAKTRSGPVTVGIGETRYRLGEPSPGEPSPAA